MREHAGEYIDLPPGADAAFFRSQEFCVMVDMYNDSLDDDGNRIGFAVFRDCQVINCALPRRPANKITYGLQGTCMHDIPGTVRYKMLFGRRVRRSQYSAYTLYVCRRFI